MGRGQEVIQNKSREWVHSFSSAFPADSNGLWLLLRLNLEWSTSNGGFEDALPQPFAVLRRDLLVKRAPVRRGWGGRFSSLQWLLFLLQSSFVSIYIFSFVLCSLQHGAFWKTQKNNFPLP